MDKPIVAGKNTLDLLTAFSDSNPEVSLATLATKVGLNKSTAYRALQTLLNCGFVEQNPETKDYRLTPKVLRLADTFLRHTDLRTIARPVLEELVWAFRETVTLALKRGDEIVFIDKVEGPGNVRFYCEVGRTLPLHAGAGAKAILAHVPPDQIERYIQAVNLKPFTEHTLVDPDQLRRDLVKIQQTGYSISDQEVDIGVSAVGAPIFNHERYPCGAVTLAGLSVHFNSAEILTKAGDQTRHAALTISRRLGYPD